MILEVGDVGIALEEPKQFVNDRFEMDFLGRQQREALLQIEAQLCAKQAQGAGPGAVHFSGAAVEDALHQVQVGAHERGRCSRKIRGKW